MRRSIAVLALIGALAGCAAESHREEDMNTTAHEHTTVFTTPSDREIQAIRTFAAPRQLVWEAWTRAEHLQRWMLGPEGWTMPVCEIDLRPGGAQRRVWRRGDSAEMESRSIFQEISPPEKLVSRESWGGEWPETVNTLLLSENGGRTTATITILYPNREARDAALATPMHDGMSQGFNRLDAHLASMR
jgi:uncharacterized protein YndB with AHSA1/START domain